MALLRAGPALIRYLEVKLKGIPQMEIADKLGIKQGSVSAWFTGRTSIKLSNLRKIIALFRLDPVETFIMAYGAENCITERLITPAEHDEYLIRTKRDMFESLLNASLQPKISDPAGTGKGKKSRKGKHLSKVAEASAAYASAQAVKALPILRKPLLGDVTEISSIGEEILPVSESEYAPTRYFLKPVDDAMLPTLDPETDLVLMQHIPVLELSGIGTGGKRERLKADVRKMLKRLRNRIVAITLNEKRANPIPTLKRLKFFDYDMDKSDGGNVVIIIQADNERWTATGWDGNERIITRSDELKIHAVALGIRRHFK